MGGGGMMGGWMLLWSLVLVALLALVVLGIVLVVRALGSQGGRDRDVPARPEALRTLEERFARGEFDRQEFEERRRTLLE
jgi:putative membrane protein